MEGISKKGREQGLPEVFAKLDILNQQGDRVLFLRRLQGDASKVVVLGPSQAMRSLMTELTRGCEMQCDGTHGLAPGLKTYHITCHGALLFRIFLERETSDAYLWAFQSIRDAFPEWQPGAFLLDGEQASAAAFRAVWPEAKVYRCTLHVWKCLVNAFSSKGTGGAFDVRVAVLSLLYNLLYGDEMGKTADQKERIWFKQRELELVCRVLRETPLFQGFADLANYLEATYGGGSGSMYSVEEWCCALRPAEVSNTTNTVEAVNRWAKDYTGVARHNAGDALAASMLKSNVKLARELRTASLAKEKAQHKKEATGIPAASITLRAESLVGVRLRHMSYTVGPWYLTKTKEGWVAQTLRNEEGPSRGAALEKVREMERLRLAACRAARSPSLAIGVLRKRQLDTVKRSIYGHDIASCAWRSSTADTGIRRGRKRCKMPLSWAMTRSFQDAALTGALHTTAWGIIMQEGKGLTEMQEGKGLTEMQEGPDQEAKAHALQRLAGMMLRVSTAAVASMNRHMMPSGARVEGPPCKTGLAALQELGVRIVLETAPTAKAGKLQVPKGGVQKKKRSPQAMAKQRRAQGAGQAKRGTQSTAAPTRRGGRAVPAPHPSL